MKIVIDIPEEVYNRCKEYRLQCGEAEVLESAVARGTPLPDTNVGDLISRQELLNAISQKEYGHDYDENTDILDLKYVDIIKRMPSVEPERKPGKWIVEEDCEGKTRTCTCNLCGYETGKYTWVNPNYCENCGAKMEVQNE